MQKESRRRRVSRREFNCLSAAALAAPLTRFLASASQSLVQRPTRRPTTFRSQRGLNILFVFTDQERYTSKWPVGLSLPTHERLRRTGVTFTQHYTSAIMC